MSYDSLTSATPDHLDPLLARMLAHELHGYTGLMRYMLTLQKADPARIPALLSVVIAHLDELLAQIQVLSAGGPPSPQHRALIALDQVQIAGGDIDRLGKGDLGHLLRTAQAAHRMAGKEP